MVISVKILFQNLRNGKILQLLSKDALKFIIKIIIINIGVSFFVRIVLELKKITVRQKNTCVLIEIQNKIYKLNRII